MTFKSHLRWSNPSAEQLQLFRPKKKKFKWHFWLTSRALMIQLSFIFLIANWIFDDQVSLMIKDKTLAIDLNWNDFVDLKFLSTSDETRFSNWSRDSKSLEHESRFGFHFKGMSFQRKGMFQEKSSQTKFNLFGLTRVFEEKVTY
jgi:hypothetical protein